MKCSQFKCLLVGAEENYNIFINLSPFAFEVVIFNVDNSVEGETSKKEM